VAKAERPAAVPNEEAQGQFSHEENVENSPIASIQPMQKVREGLDRQVFEHARDTPRKIVKIHGAA
jgi:hypothetical protein